MEEFNYLKMEYPFIKVELLIYQVKSKKVKLKNGSSTRSKPMRLSERHLNPTGKMRSYTSYTWRPIKG
jgi:hypothetical protein